MVGSGHNFLDAWSMLTVVVAKVLECDFKRNGAVLNKAGAT